MKNFRTFSLTLFIPFFGCLSQMGFTQNQSSTLPGRIGTKEIYYTQLGKAKIFFYMTPEKHALARQLVNDVNEKMVLTMDVTSPPCPINEVSAMTTKFPDPISYNQEGNPIYADPIGHELFKQYADKVKMIAENCFGIAIAGVSRDMSLIANHDALKMHQDHFTHQYDYLSQLPLPIPRYYLFQDLTLIDWQMAQGTFSATMVQDGQQGDRFLMLLLPTEVVGTVYTEPMVYNGPNSAPTYPGAITLPPHTVIAPIELDANWTVGSWKGKRISTSMRGVVKEEEIDKLCKRAIYLPVDRPKLVHDGKGREIYQYPNGSWLGHFSVSLPLWEKSSVLRLPDQDNTTVFKREGLANRNPYASLLEELGINGNLTQAFHLIKRDSGLSRFEKMNLAIPESAQVVLINRSRLPAGYLPYTLSEDCTQEGKPWIHMCYFPMNMAMVLSGASLKKMALTPVEEILFRDHKLDELCDVESKLVPKLISEIDILVVE